MAISVASLPRSLVEHKNTLRHQAATIARALNSLSNAIVGFAILSGLLRSQTGNVLIRAEIIRPEGRNAGHCRVGGCQGLWRWGPGCRPRTYTDPATPDTCRNSLVLQHTPVNMTFAIFVALLLLATRCLATVISLPLEFASNNARQDHAAARHGRAPLKGVIEPASISKVTDQRILKAHDRPRPDHAVEIWVYSIP